MTLRQQHQLQFAHDQRAAREHEQLFNQPSAGVAAVLAVDVGAHRIRGTQRSANLGGVSGLRVERQIRTVCANVRRWWRVSTHAPSQTGCRWAAGSARTCPNAGSPNVQMSCLMLSRAVPVHMREWKTCRRKRWSISLTGGLGRVGHGLGRAATASASKVVDSVPNIWSKSRALEPSHCIGERFTIL